MRARVRRPIRQHPKAARAWARHRRADRKKGAAILRYIDAYTKAYMKALEPYSKAMTHSFLYGGNPLDYVVDGAFVGTVPEGAHYTVDDLGDTPTMTELFYP